MFSTRLLFQSAPPHGGRLWTLPVSRLTTSFNPAPARGATLDSARISLDNKFQSAPPHGGRLARRRQGSRRDAVSIRAPARGATRIRWSRPARLPGFNPRPRTGGDIPVSRPLNICSAFQSAPPHGGRQEARTHDYRFNRFQSAPPHGGRRLGPRLRRRRVYVSIRAPARGATLGYQADWCDFAR